MSFEETIHHLELEIEQTFGEIEPFFDLPSELRQYHPEPNEWCMDEILEHITLTNHFLLITLSQSLKKALRRAEQGLIPTGESHLERIRVISDPDAFQWIRPEHMEPTRMVASEAVRLWMREQRTTCEAILRQIPQGEGRLHQVSMSVQTLGKLDMYEWLYFLLQHAQRHREEMARICQRADTPKN